MEKAWEKTLSSQEQRRGKKIAWSYLEFICVIFRAKPQKDLKRLLIQPYVQGAYIGQLTGYILHPKGTGIVNSRGCAISGKASVIEARFLPPIDTH